MAPTRLLRDKKTSEAQMMRWAARASVTVATVLVVIKAGVWFQSGAAAMLGSLTDSVLDLFASLVTLFAIRTSLVPADDNHRFGHGKAEALSSLFQAGLMGASAVFVMIESAQSLMISTVNSAPNLVILVSLGAIVLTLALVTFQSYVLRQTGSMAVAGDHLHYKGDLLLNLAVVLSAWAVSSGYPEADGIVGGVIGLYILYGAWHVGRPAVDMLMDRELEDTERDIISALALSSPNVKGIHDLKTRRAGWQTFIQMHVEVDGDMCVREGHKVGDEVEALLSERYPLAEILIHIDPMSEEYDQQAESTQDRSNDEGLKG